MNAAQFRKTFFDRAGIEKQLDAGVKRALSRFGAFVRQRAKTSIRKAPKVDVATGLIQRGRKTKGAELVDAVAPPGKPPFSHTGTLKKLIYFGYEPVEKSVVIGPAVGGSRSGAPEALEHGVGMPARPYMQPAFEAELQNVGGDFRNLIR